MIEKLDPRDGRYTTVITKVNELIDEVTSLSDRLEQSKYEFENHTHDIPPDGEFSGRATQTDGPQITMVDESRDQL